MGSGNHIPTDNLSARLTLYNNKKNKINMLILTSLSLLRILASRDNPKLWLKTLHGRNNILFTRVRRK